MKEIGELKDFSTEALEQELKRRNEACTKPPTLIKNPNIISLTDKLNAICETVLEEQSASEDVEHYIFEEVMMTFYGKAFFPEWWNKVIK